MTNPNDQAFPHNTFTDSQMQGLTKREYFAAMAMQGMLSDRPEDYKNNSIVSLAVGMADALIAELNKTDLK